jgi:hypothetical protein
MLIAKVNQYLQGQVFIYDIPVTIKDLALQICFYDKHCNSALVQCNSDRYRSGNAIENR